jgi:ubiquinone/menaquinone biosynthesis C-methylase UbiE
MKVGTICKLFESEAMRKVTGETIRPGGFYLTDRAMGLCALPVGAKVLDVGCGSGATVEYLKEAYRLQAVGIDPSEVQLAAGRLRNPDMPIVLARGEDLPFGAEKMDGVLAECTFSLMSDLDRTMREIYRVLKSDGRLIINDVYARNPAGIQELRQLEMESCLRGALTREALVGKLEANGFEIILWEDHTELLKQLSAKMIWTHGSMTDFWLKVSSCTIDPHQAQLAMVKAKLGYFLLIAGKKSNIKEPKTYAGRDKDDN